MAKRIAGQSVTKAENDILESKDINMGNVMTALERIALYSNKPLDDVLTRYGYPTQDEAKAMAKRNAANSDNGVKVGGGFKTK